MQSQLQKAINLTKKTGDRLLVYDAKNTDFVYVVMSLDEYEKLAIGKSEVRNLTEDELLDKINRDIAIWKSEQESAKAEEKSIMPRSFRSSVSNHGFPWGDLGGFGKNNPESDGFSQYEHEDAGQRPNPAKKHWQIPSERKQAAEEIIEEDRQYLEEI